MDICFRYVLICFEICLDLYEYLFGSIKISALITFWVCSLALWLDASAAFWKQVLLARMSSSSCVLIPPAPGPTGPSAPAVEGVGRALEGGRGVGPRRGGGRAWGLARPRRGGLQGGAGRVGPGMHVLVCHTCGWHRT